MPTAAPARRYVTDSGHLVGEDHPNARLNWHDVELMRELHDGGMPMMQIAAKFELPWSTVRDVCHYLTWGEKAVRPVRHPRRVRPKLEAVPA